MDYINANYIDGYKLSKVDAFLKRSLFLVYLVSFLCPPSLLPFGCLILPFPPGLHCSARTVAQHCSRLLANGLGAGLAHGGDGCAMPREGARQVRGVLGKSAWFNSKGSPPLHGLSPRRPWHLARGLRLT